MPKPCHAVPCRTVPCRAKQNSNFWELWWWGVVVQGGSSKKLPKSLLSKSLHHRTIPTQLYPKPHPPQNYPHIPPKLLLLCTPEFTLCWTVPCHADTENKFYSVMLLKPLITLIFNRAMPYRNHIKTISCRNCVKTVFWIVLYRAVSSKKFIFANSDAHPFNFSKIGDLS